MAKGQCFNVNLLDTDELASVKDDLQSLRKKKQIPASESVELLQSMGVKDGDINNISSQKTADMVKQFFDKYETVVDANFDSPALRDIADEKIPRFGARKLYAPVYYVLSKGGKSSQALADKLLDFDVTYTRDKAFGDDNVFEIARIMGKDIDNLNLLEKEMRNQKGRSLTVEQRKAIEAFDLINENTGKLWNMNDVGFDDLDSFTKKHIVARQYHKQMTDYYWVRAKAEVKAKSTKFQYEEFLEEFDEQYIKNYMTRAVSREVLFDIQKNGTSSPVIVKIANKRLKSRAKELASDKFNKNEKPDKWQAEYEKNLKDVELLREIKEEAFNIMTYNPARVVNNHFKKRGILLDYETEIEASFIDKKFRGKKTIKVKTYVEDYKSVMDRYTTISSKFLSTTKYFPEFTNFGTKYKISGGAKSYLYDMQNSASKEAKYVAKHLDDLLGLSNESSSMINFLSTTATLSAASGLSSPTSGIKNLLITIPRSMGTFGTITTAKAFLRLYNNYGSLMSDARRQGFTTYQTKTLALQDKAVKLPFNLGEFSMEKLFDINLMTKTEGWGRVAQVQAGLMTFELQLDKAHGRKNLLQKGNKKQIKEFWKNVFKLADDEIDFLFDKDNFRRIQDGLADADMTGKMDYIRAKVSHYSHVSTSGGTGAQLLPSWMNNRYVKPMSLFYRMAYSTTFDMYQNHLKPIYNHGNIAPLARATVGNAASGFALWWMYDQLFDTKNPVENEGEIEKIASYLWRSEFLQLGSDALNPYGPNMYSDKDKFAWLGLNEQMMASSFNPIYGTAVARNLISASTNFAHVFLPALGLSNKRKFVGQAMDDFLSETVVLYAQYRKVFQEPFGLGFKNDKLYKKNQEFRTYSRRWKAENGYTDNPLAYGATDRTPFYRTLRNAFYNGNQKDFNRTYWGAYNYIATTYLKELRKNGRGPSIQEINNLTKNSINSHLASYSVSGLSEAYSDKKGIIPEREFLNYLANDKLREQYKKAKNEFEYRKRKLVGSAAGGDNFRRFSVFYDLK